MKKDLIMFKTYFLSLLTTLKNWAISSLAVFTAFVGPIGDLLFFVVFLTLVDFATGITAAKYRGETRESSKMAKSIYKFVFYTIALLTAHLFDTYVQNLINPHLIAVFIDESSMTTLMEFKFLAALSLIIVAREAKSIDENWQTIFGWGFISSGYKLYDKVISVLSLLKNLKKS